MELIVELVLVLFGLCRVDPFKDPERDFGYLFLFGMALLLAAGAGAIVFLGRPG